MNCPNPVTLLIYIVGELAEDPQTVGSDVMCGRRLTRNYQGLVQDIFLTAANLPVYRRVSTGSMTAGSFNYLSIIISPNTDWTRDYMGQR